MNRWTGGKTDRHNEADSLYSQVCESVWTELSLSKFLHTKIFWCQLHVTSYLRYEQFVTGCGNKLRSYTQTVDSVYRAVDCTVELYYSQLLTAAVPFEIHFSHLNREFYCLLLQFIATNSHQYPTLQHVLQSEEWNKEHNFALTAFRPETNPGQPPVQCVPALCPWVQRTKREADHKILLIPKLRMRGAIIIFP